MDLKSSYKWGNHDVYRTDLVLSTTILEILNSWHDYTLHCIVASGLDSEGLRQPIIPDSKVHGANMGPTWVLSAPDGPHVGPMNLAIRDDVPSILNSFFFWKYTRNAVYVMLCLLMYLTQVYSNQSFQGSFTGTAIIVWLLKCQWRYL